MRIKSVPGSGIHEVDLRALFHSFLRGDDAAFSELYRELNPRLSAYCYKLVLGHSEDLMQELWERVIALRSKRHASDLDIQSPLAFLYRTLKNLAVDHFRRTVDSQPLSEYHTISPSNGETDLECLILEGLEKLPFEDREVLVLNIYSGYKFGEIAEMQGKSVDAVWARASRARVRLRNIVIADAARLGISLPIATNANSQKETV